MKVVSLKLKIESCFFEGESCFIEGESSEGDLDRGGRRRASAICDCAGFKYRIVLMLNLVRPMGTQLILLLNDKTTKDSSCQAIR